MDKEFEEKYLSALNEWEFLRDERLTYFSKEEISNHLKKLKKSQEKLANLLYNNTEYKDFVDGKALLDKALDIAFSYYNVFQKKSMVYDMVVDIADIIKLIK